MKRRKRKGEGFSKTIVGRFDIPEDILFDVPRMLLCDNKELRIENYKTVMEYENDVIKLACKDKFICITGKALTITVITNDEVSIKGIITSISFS